MKIVIDTNENHNVNLFYTIFLVRFSVNKIDEKIDIPKNDKQNTSDLKIKSKEFKNL